MDHFSEIISIDNLLSAWQEFIKGKRGKSDVQKFSANLFENILQLHYDLFNKTYQHGEYYNFNISDPKPRNISKASVRDRLVHHAIFRILYPYFDNKFIFDSYSCRKDKGTHKAMNRLQAMFNKVSVNNTKACYVLQCDIRKFFASINHDKLVGMLSRQIFDSDIMWLLKQIIGSFPSKNVISGLPLGNLTSQLFVNIYMNELDQFIKHYLKEKYYIRYADDFVFLSQDKNRLEKLIPKIEWFLKSSLELSLHPKKVTIKCFASGIDFLGWVHFPNHRVLRTSAKRRMFNRIKDNPSNTTLQSYLGLLSHGNTHQLEQLLKNNYWLFKSELL